MPTNTAPTITAPRPIQIRTEPLPGSGCAATLHGTRWAWHKGCTCPDAATRQHRERKLERHGLNPTPQVDGTGTRRRLRALAAIGYSTRYLGVQLDCTMQRVYTLTTSHGTVHRLTAARVDQLYRALSGLPAGANPAIHPHATLTERARWVRFTMDSARRRGWLNPLCWEGRDIDDPDAVPDRTGLLHGRDVVDVDGDVQTFLELHAENAGDERWLAAWKAMPSSSRPTVVAALSAIPGPGMGGEQLGRLFGCSERTILRHRATAKLRAAAAADEAAVQAAALAEFGVAS